MKIEWRNKHERFLKLEHTYVHSECWEFLPFKTTLQWSLGVLQHWGLVSKSGMFDWNLGGTSSCSFSRLHPLVWTSTTFKVNVSLKNMKPTTWSSLLALLHIVLSVFADFVVKAEPVFSSTGVLRAVVLGGLITGRPCLSFVSQHEEACLWLTCLHWQRSAHKRAHKQVSQPTTQVCKENIQAMPWRQAARILFAPVTRCHKTAAFKSTEEWLSSLRRVRQCLGLWQGKREVGGAWRWQTHLDVQLLFVVIRNCTLSC